MSGRKLRVSSWVGVVALGFCVLGAAAIKQHLIGWNEMSHFAQIRAFDHGTPRIDAYHHTTGDRAYYHGHWYGDKAPGLAFLMTPVYALARALHLASPNGPGMIHLIELFACVLPFALILVLAFRLLGRTDPGQRTIVPLSLGLGTLLLPFATMLFSHVLSACMGFGAYYLLLRERERPCGSLALVLAAGVLGGYAIGTEYPLALLVAVLGLLVAWRPGPAKPVLAYGAGVAIGLIPLGLYDWWAFGAPWHLSYSYVAANSAGVLGLGAPSVWSAVKLLISGRGLFVVMPVTAAALAGIVVLYREGRRLEALVPAAVGLVYFIYNSAYYLPFGGAVPGPRFLITVIPFLTVPLAAAYRRAPLTTLALAVVSAVTMITATLTVPILSLGASTDTWWDRLTQGWFGTPPPTVDLFAAFTLLAVLAAALVTPRFRVTRPDIRLAAVALAGWFAIERAVPPIVSQYATAERVSGLIALVALGVALTAVVADVARDRRLAWLAGIPIVALAVRRLDHTTLMLALAAASIGFLLVLDRAFAGRARVSGTAP